MIEKDEVRVTICRILDCDPCSVPDDSLLMDLVNSSFQLVELIIELEEEYRVRFGQEDMEAVATLGQLRDLVTARAAGAAGD